MKTQCMFPCITQLVLTFDPHWKRVHSDPAICSVCMQPTYDAQTSVPVHGDPVDVQDTMEAAMGHELCDDHTLRLAGADGRP